MMHEATWPHPRVMDETQTTSTKKATLSKNSRLFNRDRMWCPSLRFVGDSIFWGGVFFKN